MKLVPPILLAAIMASAADAPSGRDQDVPAQITKKRHETRDANGEVYAYAETFYRGGDRILIQAVYTKPQPSGIKMWREYVVGGHTVLKEMDYGDTKPQMVWVFRDDAIWEAFRRHPEGSIEPMTSEELAKAKQGADKLMVGFERVMGEVRARTKTNSVEKVMGDLKSEVEQQKQRQRPGGEPR